MFQRKNNLKESAILDEENKSSKIPNIEEWEVDIDTPKNLTPKLLDSNEKPEYSDKEEHKEEPIWENLFGDN